MDCRERKEKPAKLWTLDKLDAAAVDDADVVKVPRRRKQNASVKFRKKVLPTKI